MRKFVLMLLAGLGILIADVATSTADAQSCRELRRACELRDQLGERGEGNCRRFRERCGDFRRRDDRDVFGGNDRRCDRLRRACLFREERGEQGQGNCRRFREECGGGGDRR